MNKRNKKSDNGRHSRIKSNKWYFEKNNLRESWKGEDDTEKKLKKKGFNSMAAIYKWYSWIKRYCEIQRKLNHLKRRKMWEKLLLFCNVISAKMLLVFFFFLLSKYLRH